MTKSNSRLRQQCSKLYKIVGGVLSLAPAMSEKYKRRYVGMISPDITISNHRLRWAVDGMRFTAPLQISENNKKFYICSDGTHTHTHLACSEVGFLEELRWRNRQYTSEMNL